MACEHAATFGAVLHHARVAARLTQEQLATRAGLSSDAIAALERGRRRCPRPSTLQRLAAALSLTGNEREALLAAARLRGYAPPACLGTLVETPTKLPVHRRTADPAEQPTPLIGRTSELASIREQLVGERAEGARLLTLVGPAGVGKTRLALAIAAQLVNSADSPFPDGVLLVDLTPISDPLLVVPTIAEALGLTDTGHPPLSERLCDFLRERALLLVLDNCEQVLPAAIYLADLLASCPQLRLLVTSRVPLQLRWEQVVRIAPLPVPDLQEALPPLDALARVPAVTLFVARALARRADFVLTEQQAPLVAQLVVQLDGLPLALELAAARMGALTLPLIVRRLEDRVRLMRWEAPDRPARHQSLEAAVGWSYDLLSDGVQHLFRCLGVFSGRVSLDAIAAVVAATPGARAAAGTGGEGDTLAGLASLAEQSLVLPPGQERHRAQADDDSEPAFTMLETVREYAWEQLERLGELTAARRAHAHYFLSLAERANPLLRGHDQRAWFVRLEREHDNLRAALRWLLDQDDPVEREAALRLAGALDRFWLLRGYHTEGVRWLEEALHRAPAADLEAAAASTTGRIQALLAAGALLTQLGDFERARAVLEEALALAKRRQNPAARAQALSGLGVRAGLAGDWASGVPLLREALTLWQDLGDPHRIGETHFLLAQAAFAQGADVDAAALEADAVERLEAAGDARFAATVRFNLAAMLWHLGDLPRAVQQIQAALQISRTFDDRRLLSIGVGAALAVIGERADSDQSAQLLGAADALSQATGATPLWERVPVYQAVAKLRERLKGDGWGAAYRTGRSLPSSAVATLALALLEELGQTLAPPELLVTRSLTLASHTPLSEREQEVLRLVAQGRTNKAIGRQLFIAASTVDYHLSSVFHKLGVETRAQAVAVAAQRGLL
jgi:non-specific serine/threonine protein kinase